MDDKYIYTLQADVCKAFSNPVRIEIIELLNKKELCFTDILEHVGGLKSSLSQNLSVLVNAGILNVRKESRCNYYTLSSPKVYKACAIMKEVLIENLEKKQHIIEKVKSEL